MSWDFNVDTRIHSCARCAKDTRSDMTGSHSFTLDRIRATVVFTAEVEGEPICQACAATLLSTAAEELK